MNISNRQHDSSVPPDTKESSPVELRGGASRGEISDWNLASRHHLLAVTDRQTRPWSWCCDRGSVKPYLTMSACSRARPATGTHSAVEKYKLRHVLALLIVFVWMERIGEPVDIPGIPRRQ